MKMTLEISSQTTQFEQMAAHLHVQPDGNCLRIPSHLGEGFLRYYALPYQIQVHHYQYRLKDKIEVEGHNSKENGLYMLNVNLSHRILHKNIGDAQQALSKGGKSGALFYSPGHHSKGSNEPGQLYEVVFFAFPKTALNALFSINELLEQPLFCVYAELPDELGNDLKAALQPGNQQNKAWVIGKFLQVLSELIELFSHRQHLPASNLNLQDVERQLKVKEILLDHLFGNLPTIDTLASEVHVSKSKLKSDFKSLFGNSIYQYYLAKKMETAKELLTNQTGTISEIGHQLGYSNTAHFSAQFKKHFGISPSQVEA